MNYKTVSDNRQKLDEALIKLTEPLRRIIGPGAGYAGYPQDISNSSDLSLLLRLALEYWEPVFQSRLEPYGVTYRLIDKVRHIRNDWAHNKGDFTDPLYLEESLQAIQSLQRKLPKSWAQAQRKQQGPRRQSPPQGRGAGGRRGQSSTVEKVQLYMSLAIGVIFFFITFESNIGDLPLARNLLVATVAGIIGFALPYFLIHNFKK